MLVVRGDETGLVRTHGLVVRPAERSIWSWFGLFDFKLPVLIWQRYTTEFRIVRKVTEGFDLLDRDFHWRVSRRAAFLVVGCPGNDVLLKLNLVHHGSPQLLLLS